MTKRISELPAAGGVADTDELELNQAGASRKATRGQIVAGLASAFHQHDLADISDAGALAALDAVRPTEIDSSAYATQVDAIEGIDGTRIMTPGRTAEAIAAKAAPHNHQHELADIVDAGALAALDGVGTAEIAATAYASQAEAVAGADNAKIMTALRTAEAIAAQAVSPEHQHNLADITDAGALAGLDAIRPTEIDPSAYATQADAAEGIDGTRIMTAVRTAEAIAAKAAPQDHQHSIADITDAGALAALDAIGTAEIAAAAYAS